jgi:2-polyprenyl-6-hydroxyphenyl methylase/3-demethylubiquinone-9 3-methyltransferase
MPLKFLSDCSRCLNVGGSLFISTISRSLKAYLLTIVAAEHILGIIPPGEK